MTRISVLSSSNPCGSTREPRGAPAAKFDEAPRHPPNSAPPQALFPCRLFHAITRALLADPSKIDGVDGRRSSVSARVRGRTPPLVAGERESESPVRFHDVGFLSVTARQDTPGWSRLAGLSPQQPVQRIEGSLGISPHGPRSRRPPLEQRASRHQGSLIEP